MSDLEERVARLEIAVEQLRSAVNVTAGAPATLPAPAGSRRTGRLGAGAPDVSEASWLSLTGVLVLAFGGAYCLRALTESRLVPDAVGVALGLAYAAIWIWNADRCARNSRRRNAIFHTATAAGIAYPLVWETTTRFHWVTPAAGGAIAAILGLVILGVAWRDEQQSIAWIGSIGSIAVMLSIASPPTLLPLMISGSVVGAGTLWVALRLGWTFVAWPAAILTNVLAALTIGITLLHGGIYNPAGVIIALVAYATVWLAAIAARRMLHHEDLSLFDICESALLLIVGAGGAAAIALTQHAALIPLGVWYALGGIGGYIIALTKFNIGTAPLRTWFSAVGGYLTALALLLLLPKIALTAMAWAVAGVIVAEIDRRHPWAPLKPQIVLFFLGAAAAGGVVVSMLNAIFSTTAGAIELSQPAIVIAALALIAFARSEARAVRTTLLAIVATAVFFCATWGIAAITSPPDQATLALVRTAVLAAIAAILARVPAGSGIARAILVIGGIKLIAEDVRLGRAAILVIAFAAYGCAMLIVARSGKNVGRALSPP